MKAIMMAAGVGSRLSEAPHDPKCTLPIGEGQSVISHTMQIMKERAIEHHLVIGYERNKVRAALSSYPEVIYHENPFFRRTNSIGSCWLARSVITEAIRRDEDLLLANADVYWTDDLLDMLCGVPDDCTMLCDRSRATTGDYFFHLVDGYIVEYGKDIAPERRDCEYVGITLIRASFLPVFLGHLDQLIWREKYDMWWEDALYDACASHPVRALDVEGRFWSEIDYAEDYQRILDHLNTGMSATEMLSATK